MFLAWRVAAAATLLAACAPERWRIDSKVRFVDEDAHDKAVRDKKQVDEVSFKEPKDTSVFYSQPSGAGRYPVNYQFNPKSMSSEYTSRNIRPSHYSDGIINSLHYCKCVSTPKCNPQPDYSHACGADQYLCCFKRPSNIPVQNSEFFKKVDDERPILIPGKDTVHGAFSPPMSNKLYPFGQLDGGLDIPGAHNAQLESPIGQMGPKRPVLVGPDGPTGQLSLPQRLILVRPDGPSGVIGLDNGRLNKPIRDIGHTTSAMRGVLVRSGSLPGINGAYHQRQMLLESGGQRGVLSGPGDPINTIGLPAYKRKFRTGPVSKGTIGSERQLLVVPGGHIRQIAHIVPPRYFGN